MFHRMSLYIVLDRRPDLKRKCQAIPLMSSRVGFYDTIKLFWFHRLKLDGLDQKTRILSVIKVQSNSGYKGFI